MRRVAAIPTCLAIVLAFGFAPFEHVHADHGHGVVMHAHAMAHSPARVLAPTGPAFDDDDDHAAVRSLDTFTLAFAPRITPFVLTEQAFAGVDATLALHPIEAVEECAHDPPALECSNPRAPPA